MDTSNFKEVFESPKVKTLTAQVAALELEVARLRDVIFDMAGEEPGISWGKADKVLSTPFTPAALPELIEKVEKLTIERCAEVHKDAASKAFSASGIVWADKFEREIRALPTGQIKLEELL